MNYIKIVSDTACDLIDEFVQKNNISLVPFYVTVDGENYLKEEIELKSKEFYEILSLQNAFPKTSLPSVSDYLECFESCLKQGQDVICFCLSSNFSGSFQSAVNAKNILKEQYENTNNFKIEIIDTQLATGAQAVLILEACKLRDLGASFEQIVSAVENGKNNATVLFTLDSLEYLQKGGRVSKVAAFAGGILNIKPILQLENGNLSSKNKIRGRKKAVDEVIKMFENILPENKEQYIYYACHTDCIEEAKYILSVLKEQLNIKVNLPIFRVGATVGSHIGPTVVGVGFNPKLKIN